MWEFFTQLLKLMEKEPVVGVALTGAIGTIAILLSIIYVLYKWLREVEAARMKERESYYTCIDKGLRETALSMNTLINFMEVLVHRRGND